MLEVKLKPAFLANCDRYFRCEPLEIGGIKMPINNVIDELVATCDGNLRGAVKAPLLVNEC